MTRIDGTPKRGRIVRGTRLSNREKAIRLVWAAFEHPVVADSSFAPMLRLMRGQVEAAVAKITEENATATLDFIRGVLDA